MSNDNKSFSSLKRSVSSPGTTFHSFKTFSHYSGGAINEGYSYLCDTVDSPKKMLTLASSPTSSTSSSSSKPQSPVRHSFSHTCSLRNKSLEYQFNQLDLYQSQDEDAIVDVLKVSPEDLASQLTQIDLPIFQSIQPDELLTCGGWSRNNKHEVAPNVVAFTTRFNRVSFWVVQEILSAIVLKNRGKVLSHFIKVAKRLYELNNLHSAYAVTSALTSAPIHRLNKTWNLLSKKDKLTFERLNELFSDNENFEKLRDHLSNCKTPCIPYLGMFLRDIVYVDVAHPQSGGLENRHRQTKLDNILRMISEFQRSNYDNLPVIPNVQKYLLLVRYIEELQKFLEDDNFKLSLKLEPPEIESRLSNFYASRDILNTSSKSAQECLEVNDKDDSTLNCHSLMNLMPDQQQLNQSIQLNNSMPDHQKKKGFIPNHRKALSLGTNVLTGLSFSYPLSLSSANNVTSANSVTSANNMNIQKYRNRCLIDDSPINSDDLHIKKCERYETSKMMIPTFEVIQDDNY